jgi:arginyl-tRNA---protein transferase
MRVDHYQELVDRGWRRSGTTYYKPDLVRSCCPHYTIRLKANDFRATKDQRSAINKLNNYIIGPEYKRKAAMLCPQPRDVKRQKRDKFDVVDAAHKAEHDRLPKPFGKQSGKQIEPEHSLQITLEPDSCTKEKHAVMLKYQTKIHKDPEWRWTELSFTRFLCNGLDRKILKIKGRTMKLGSYHQCYRIDGKLVAVGVLDLLPHAVSSVYLFYDPDYSHWDWGKISALQEIALAQEKGYGYYYMGYYIHNCQKMLYKGRFEPSLILDPESLSWHPLDDTFKGKLNVRKYVSMSADAKAESAKKGVSEVTTSPSRVEGMTKEKLGKKLKGDEIDVDTDPSDADDTDIPEGSLFDYAIPGVLTKQEVEKLDLGHMQLVVRTSLIDLEDLRDWEEWKIDEPDTIKGIAAELIAATGPNLLKDTALSLF